MVTFEELEVTTEININATEIGITASTTQTQGQQPLIASYNEITTVANDGDVVTLPNAIQGITVVIRNGGANRLQVFPALGDGIITFAVDNSIFVPPNATIYFSCVDNVNWAITARADFDISCKVTKTTDQSIPNNTMTTINWNSELYDTDSMHDNVTDNSRITFKTAGKYSILVQSEWGINSGGFRFMEIIKNGVDSISRVRNLAENASEHNIAFVGEFAVNDYIELIVFQDTGGNLDFEAGAMLENTYLEAHKIN